MMNVRRLLPLLLFCALALVACGAPAAQPPAPTSAPAAAATPADALKGKKIGVIYLTLSHPYYQAHQKQTQEYAQQLGVTLIERDGKVDSAVQTQAMEDLIAQKVDGIIFALLDPAASTPPIQEAHAANIPVVTFAIRHGEGVQVPFVGVDEGAATYDAGKEAAKRFHEKFGADTPAKIITVECPATQAVVDRADGFIKGFTEVDPKATVLVRADGKCVRDKALAAMEDALQAHPDVNVVYGGNGDSSLGALAALQGANKGKADQVFLVSHDGTEPEMLELVNPESALKLVVANRPLELSHATLDTMGEVLAGKRDLKKNSDVLVGATVLTPDDIGQLEAFLKKEYKSDAKLGK